MSELTTQRTQYHQIPFDPPRLLESKRITGLVMLPEQEKPVSSEGKDDDGGNPLDLEWNTSRRNLMTGMNDDHHPGPPSLSRRSSLSGNILLVGKDEGAVSGHHQTAYWLQRKMAKTMHGSIRVGFVLKKHRTTATASTTTTSSDDECDNFPGAEWDAVRSSSSTNSPYPYEMVTIQMEEKSRVLVPTSAMDQQNGDNSNNSNSVTYVNTEISALQLLSATTTTTDNENSHVQSSSNVSVDATTVYTITPYHGEGTLFQYVAEAHRLEEPVARHFFRQILKGLQTLRKAGICHRALSLENILLRGPDITITDLRSALRISSGGCDDVSSPTNNNSNSTTTPSLITSNPKYVAPEMIVAAAAQRREDENDDELLYYNGFEVDLWAAGIILCSMLFGTDAPFVWASPDDGRYREICIKGNLRTLSSRWEAINNSTTLSQEFSPSTKRVKVVSESALDLIQSMLRAKREERLTLEQVLEHDWVVQGEVEAPTFSSPLSTAGEH